jgi:hypothetical protein
MGPQSRENPNFDNFGTPICESWDKMPFGCGPCEEAHNIVYYKGEGGGFPPSPNRVESWESELPVACPSTKSAPTMH